MALKTRTISAIAAAAIALTAGISTAAGQSAEPPQAARRQGLRPGGPGGPGRPGPAGLLALGRLNLTEEQRQQVRAVLAESRGGAKDERPVLKMLELRRSLRAAVLADTPDPAQIEQLRAAIVEAEAAALSKRLEIETKIAQILTPEQKAAAREMPARPAGRRRM